MILLDNRVKIGEFIKEHTIKVIIAGSRVINDEKLVSNAIEESGFAIDEVVSGGALGVDRLGENWARKNHKKVIVFKADWEKHGKSACPIRNAKMAEYADCLIAVWDGVSRGTRNMIDQMNKLGKKVYVKRYER